MYLFSICILDMHVNFNSQLLQVLVLIITAKNCDFSGFSQSCWQVSGASDNLISILWVDI